MNTTQSDHFLIVNQTTMTVEPAPQSFAAYKMATLLFQVYSPIILIFGNFGNVMCIVIMSRMTSGDSTVNIFFMAIAIGDLLMLYTGTTLHWLEAVVGIRLGDIWPIFDQLHFWIVSDLGATVGWLLACVTLQRAMSVLWPHRVAQLCTKRRIFCVILGIILFLGGIYSQYIYHYVTKFSAGPAVTHDINGTSLHSQSMSAYGEFLENVFPFVDMFVFTLFPFSCLVVGNSIIITRLVSSTRQLSTHMTVANDQQVINRKRASNSVTITVIVVSVTFVILTMPGCLYVILIYFTEQSEKTTQDIAETYLIFSICISMSGTNSAVNFYLYCLTGRRFRQEFVKILRCWRNAVASNTPSSAPTTVTDT